MECKAILLVSKVKRRISLIWAKITLVVVVNSRILGRKIFFKNLKEIREVKKINKLQIQHRVKVIIK